MGLVDRTVSLLITSTANDSQLQTLFNYLIRYGDVSRVSEFIREVAERSPSQGEADDNCREAQAGRPPKWTARRDTARVRTRGAKGTQEEALRIAHIMLEQGIDRDLVQLITGLCTAIPPHEPDWEGI